jgi:hypothetical protein
MLGKKIKKQSKISLPNGQAGKVADYKLTAKEKAHALTHKSQYKGFVFIKTLTGVHKTTESGEKKFFKFHKSYQRIYKAIPNYNAEELDNVVPKILNNPKIQGVLLVFEIYNKLDDVTQMISNYINKPEMARIRENKKTVYEYILSNFNSYGAFVLKLIYLRIIYHKKV